jgi:Carboxypeptidase regulatory-like domain
MASWPIRDPIVRPAAATLEQIERARQPEGKNRADGVSLFSYATLSAPAAAGSPASPMNIAGENPATNHVLFLASGSPPEPAAFPRPAAVPAMDWIERLTLGWLSGTARDSQGNAVDGAAVVLKRAGWFGGTHRSTADGNGFFGFAGLRPGRYRIHFEAAGKRSLKVEVEVVAGQVAQVELIEP